MAEPRFIPWSPVAEVSFGPDDRVVTVGPVTLAADADTLWVRVTQLSGPSPWPYSYGLVSWISSGGRELGTAKAYGHLEGETFRLGSGLSPVDRDGLLVFEPRNYNLGWLRASGERWYLRFEQYSARSGGTGGPINAIAGAFVTSVGQGLELARVVFP